MQKGLATLEIIFAVMIIAVLTNVAVPNAARIIDRAALDYETKRLYSELRFVQTMSRSNTIKETGMGKIKIVTDLDNTRKFTLSVDSLRNNYQVFRGIDKYKKALREPHYLSNGMTIKFRENATSINISFDNAGKVEINSNENSSNKEFTLHLISRLKKENCIIFDTVGRISVVFTTG